MIREVYTILYGGFETLDVFGPIEIFGRMKDHFSPHFYSSEGGIVMSSQDVPVMTAPMLGADAGGHILLVPGGAGVVSLIRNEEYIRKLRMLAQSAEYVFTVCTGSILFSKTGLLDGKRATSNKRLFSWAQNESPAVRWAKKARWVKDGNIYTSSGVSAGIDMTLAFVSDLIGPEAAKRQSIEIEYLWNGDPDSDPFWDLY